MAALKHYTTVQRQAELERVFAKFTSQFFRIISNCFLNHQHPVGTMARASAVVGENKHRELLQPSLFTERIWRIYYFRLILTTKTNFSAECSAWVSPWILWIAIDCVGTSRSYARKMFPLKSVRLLRYWSMKFLIASRMAAAPRALLFKWEMKMKFFW